MEEFAVLRKQIPTFQVCHPCKETHTARKQKLFCDRQESKNYSVTVVSLLRMEAYPYVLVTVYGQFS